MPVPACASAWPERAPVLLGRPAAGERSHLLEALPLYLVAPRGCALGGPVIPEQLRHPALLQALRTRPDPWPAEPFSTLRASPLTVRGQRAAALR